MKNLLCHPKDLVFILEALRDFKQKNMLTSPFRKQSPCTMKDELEGEKDV